MQNEALIFDISSLLEEPQGAKLDYSFKGPAKLEDLVLKSDIKGKVEIMKIDEGLNVHLQDVSVKVESRCDHCLKPTVESVEVPDTERVFYFYEPEDVEDENDLYLVDSKHQQIDLSEMLRQEIILHFPPNSVCSSGCKGGYRDESVPENKPFAGLKDLIKDKK